MKFVSVILLACIVFLSSFGGMVKPAQPKMVDCCKKMAKTACEHKPDQKKKADDACGMPGCAMMLTCSICGFVTSKPLTIQPPHGNLMQKSVAHYKTGDLAAYHPDNWKPPKIC